MFDFSHFFDADVSHGEKIEKTLDCDRLGSQIGILTDAVGLNIIYESVVLHRGGKGNHHPQSTECFGEALSLSSVNRFG